MKKMLCAGLVLALTCGGAAAQELADVKLGSAKVTLLGDRLDSGFVYNLLLRVDDGVTPYVVDPGVNGGYDPKLMTVKLKKDESQVLLDLAQGAGDAVRECRIFAVRKREAESKERTVQSEERSVESKELTAKTETGKTADGVNADAKTGTSQDVSKDELQPAVSRLTAIFGAEESAGVIREAVLTDHKLRVRLLDGNRQQVAVDPKIWERIENGFARGYMPEYRGLHTLYVSDRDQDGVQELYSSQRIELQGHDLGYIAARLDLQQDDSWKASHYVLQLPPVPNKKEEVLNRGIRTDAYEIRPAKLFVEQGQGAFPEFTGRDKETNARINGEFAKVYAPMLDKLFSRKALMGFEVILAFENILSVRFIGGEPRLNRFVHVDPADGHVLGIQDMFTVNSGFLKRMSELSPSKHKYSKKDLANWFMKDTKLNIILQSGSKQQAEQFTLGQFEEFLSPKNRILAVNKDKDKDKDSKTKATAKVDDDKKQEKK